MKEIFALRLYVTPVREQYKLKKKEASSLWIKTWEVLVQIFGILCLTIKNLPNIWMDIKILLKYGTVLHVVGLYVPYRFDK